MMRRISSFLLMLSLSISIVGCGNASAISESSNANTDISSTVSSEPLSGSPLSVINTTGTDNVSEETTTEVAEVASDSEPEQNFTGSLYTLPVGAKGEEWTEEQLDEYLKDCKAYQKLCQPNENGKIKVDIDELMKEFGFEYVDTYDGNNVYNVYWKQVGNLRIASALTTDSYLYIYLENEATPLRVVLFGTDFTSAHDDIVTFYTQHIDDGDGFMRTTLRHLKGTVATLNYLCNSTEIDCGRLPYPAEYSMDILTSGSFNLNKSVNFVSTDITLETHNVYH